MTYVGHIGIHGDILETFLRYHWDIVGMLWGCSVQNTSHDFGEALTFPFPSQAYSKRTRLLP